MAFIAHSEGLGFMLEVLFTAESSLPGHYYLGLCNDTLVESDGLADIIDEPAALYGYARIELDLDAVDFDITADGTGMKVEFDGTWTASGGSIGPFNTWFLATTSDDSGILVFSGPCISAGTRTIDSGDSYTQQAYSKADTA